MAAMMPASGGWLAEHECGDLRKIPKAREIGIWDIV
jgi:hypothetical protein